MKRVVTTLAGYGLSLVLFLSTASAATIRMPGNHGAIPAKIDVLQYPIPVTIQEMIDHASEGDTVLIPDGTYTGEGNINLDFNGKNIVLKSINGPESVVIDCEGNGRGFYFHSGESENSILDGLTIQNGHATYGGGIYCENSSPTFKNCVLRMNGIKSKFSTKGDKDSNDLTLQGGGIYLVTSNSSIYDCIIENNSARLDGAGMFSDCSNILMEKTILTLNSSNYGGGIYSNSGTLELNNCQVNYNYASDWGGGIAARSSTVFLDSTSIIGNETKTTDYGKGGGLYFDDSYISIIGCDIIENFSRGDGGGIYSKYTEGDIIGCIIANNDAWGDLHTYGGGIFDFSMLINVTDCTILKNSAYGGGGLFLCLAASGCTVVGNFGVQGAGLRSVFAIENCTVYNNQATEEGGGIFNFRTDSEVVNCIVRDNWPDQILFLTKDIDVSYSNVMGGWPGEGNIDSDPLFTNPDSLDFTLLPDSPCIDTGDPTFEVPLGGGSRIDMGAFEYWYGWNILPGTLVD